MSQQELLRKVIEVFDNTSIDYMVSGSVVSSLQGEPRASHDIDIVIVIDKNSVKEIIKFFPFPDFHLDEESIIEAINTQGMFNLINMNTGDKVDFWVLTEEPFDKSRFARKYVEEIMGIKIKMSRPEDTILMKLKWEKLSGGSEKQFIDALRVYEVQFEKLDMEYLHNWARELSIEASLERLEKEAEIM